MPVLLGDVLGDQCAQGQDGACGRAHPHCPHRRHKTAEVNPQELPGDCRAISYGVITSSMLNELKPLPGTF